MHKKNKQVTTCLRKGREYNGYIFHTRRSLADWTIRTNLYHFINFPIFNILQLLMIKYNALLEFAYKEILQVFEYHVITHRIRNITLSWLIFCGSLVHMVLRPPPWSYFVDKGLLSFNNFSRCVARWRKRVNRQY